jgi:hypothetical protein
MSDLFPDGEDVRCAVKWISDNLQDHNDKPVNGLVQEAIFRFNLSPRDAEFLVGFFRERQERTEPKI